MIRPLLPLTLLAICLSLDGYGRPYSPGPPTTGDTYRPIYAAYALKAGYQTPQSSDNRLLLDVYGGLRTRYVQVSRSDLPSSITPMDQKGLLGQWSTFPFTPQTTLSLSLGIKLGYAF